GEHCGDRFVDPSGPEAGVHQQSQRAWISGPIFERLSRIALGGRRIALAERMFAEQLAALRPNGRVLSDFEPAFHLQRFAPEVSGLLRLELSIRPQTGP